jgi:hypothetical protein
VSQVTDSQARRAFNQDIKALTKGWWLDMGEVDSFL